jgi:antitoxin VapB
MGATRTAKLFKNGASQAVRLPSEFRFKGTRVYVSRDTLTGDVVLSRRPGAHSWGEFFDLVKSLDLPSTWLKNRPLNAVRPVAGVFDDET